MSVQDDLAELTELRAEVSRREQRFSLRNTRAVLDNLVTMSATLDGLKETARLSGTTDSLAVLVAVVSKRLKETQERITVILRWQAHSDPESEPFRRSHSEVSREAPPKP